MTRCFSHGDRGVLGVSVSATNKWHAKVELQAVADPDLQIGGGGSHPDPEIRGGGGAFSKKNFSTLPASFWSKNKGGPGLPGPLPWIWRWQGLKRA